MSGHRYPHCRVATHPEWYPTEDMPGTGFISNVSRENRAREEALAELHGPAWRWHDPMQYLTLVFFGLIMLVYMIIK